MPNYTIKSTKIDKTNFNNNQPHNYTSNNNSSNIITKIEENNNNNIENNIETLDINNEYSENNLLSTYINNLQKYGFTETDINRVLNGEIELETLYNEIQKDNDNTRRTLLMESQYLQNSCNTMNQIYAAEGKQLNLNYNNIKELEEDIKNILKNQNEHFT